MGRACILDVIGLTEIEDEVQFGLALEIWLFRDQLLDASSHEREVHGSFLGEVVGQTVEFVLQESSALAQQCLADHVFSLLVLLLLASRLSVLELIVIFVSLARYVILILVV